MIFFTYIISTGEVDQIFNGMPDNPDFETTGEIIFDGNRTGRGIKWSRVGWDSIEDNSDIKIIPGYYLYDPATETLSENPNYEPEALL